MNARILSSRNVDEGMLDTLAREMPAIIAGVLDVPGGNLARLKPAQVSLEFSQASLRDVGSDIRIMLYAKRNDPRISTENERAKAILDKILALADNQGKDYSINVRLYFMEIGAAEHVENK